MLAKVPGTAEHQQIAEELVDVARRATKRKVTAAEILAMFGAVASHLIDTLEDQSKRRVATDVFLRNFFDSGIKKVSID